MSGSATDGFALSAGALIRIVLSPLFPLILLTTCAASLVLSTIFGIPHFRLWLQALISVIAYDRIHLWAALATGAFVLGALPLAWIAFKEHAAKASAVIGAWVGVAIVGGVGIWLTNVWSFDSSILQQVVFAFLLFGASVEFCQALMGTLKLISASRPRPGREIVEDQKVHGDARLALESEAVSLLRSRR